MDEDDLVPCAALPRPPKNYNVLERDSQRCVTPDQMFRGHLGPLPYLLIIDVGHMEGLDPFMDDFAREEILFAFKEGSQTRVLMHDSCNKSLSLPLSSSLTFHLAEHEEELTLSQIVARQGQWPVRVKFARADRLEFVMNDTAKDIFTDVTFFGTLTLVCVYEEPFYWCLSLKGSGEVQDMRPRVIPRNLHDVSFAPVKGILGVNDSDSTLKDMLAELSLLAQQVPMDDDPFFQELALVSNGPTLVKEVKPYIAAGTFIRTRHKPPNQKLARSDHPPPPLPGRSSTPRKADKADRSDEVPYSALEQVADDNMHYYSVCAQFPSKRPPASIPSKVSSALGSVSSLPVPERPRGARTGSDDTSKMMQSSRSDIRATLDSLSIDDLSQKLKELGLGKFAKKFRKHRIDGVLLQKLTEKTLKSDFKLSHLEFLRLNTFVTEGHIPKA